MKCKLSIRIKELCRSKGMQQKDLAQKMGITPESLSRTINGNPQLSTIISLAKALNVELSELFIPQDDPTVQRHLLTPIPIRRDFLCLVMSGKRFFILDNTDSIPGAIKILKQIYEDETDFEPAR